MPDGPWIRGVVSRGGPPFHEVTLGCLENRWEGPYLNLLRSVSLIVVVVPEQGLPPSFPVVTPPLQSLVFAQAYLRLRSQIARQS